MNDIRKRALALRFSREAGIACPSTSSLLRFFILVEEAISEHLHTELQSENETLRTRLAEIEGQEPVAWEWVTPENGMHISHIEPAEYEEVYHLKPLYAAPVVSPDIEKLKAEIVSLRQQIRASQSNVMARDEYIQSLTTELVAALTDAESDWSVWCRG